MKKYKLIKWYPSLSNIMPIGFEVCKNEKLCNYSNLQHKFNALSLDEVENNPEFWEEIKEKEWEITSQVLEVRAAFLYGYTIKSVKRLSDNEIFSVGDKVDNVYNTIIGFEITNDNNIRVKLKRNDSEVVVGLLLNSLKIRKYLFKTEDDVEIFDGDNFYLIGKEFTLKYWDFKTHNYIGNEIYLKDKVKFSNEKSAQYYIDLNKPQYSLKEIEEAMYAVGFNTSSTSSVKRRILNLKK